MKLVSCEVASEVDIIDNICSRKYNSLFQVRQSGIIGSVPARFVDWIGKPCDQFKGEKKTGGLCCTFVTFVVTIQTVF
jgi:hypothetical protein